MWKVLLVEDEPFARKALRQIMDWEAQGFTLCGEADNGEEALRMAEALRPDLVICDIAMPVMDGIEMLTRVRDQGLELEFIMLTCFSEFEYARHSLELGALHYILKGSMKAATLEEALQKAARVLSRKADQKHKEQRLQQHEHRLLYEGIWDYYHGYFESAAEREQALLELENTDRPTDLDRRLQVYMTWHEGDGADSSWLYNWLGEQARDAEIHPFLRSNMLTVFVWGGTPPVLKRELVPGHLPGVIRRTHSPGLPIRETWGELLREWNLLWYGDYPLSAGAEGSAQPADEHLPPVRGLEWSQEREFIRCFEMAKIDGAVRTIGEIWEGMAARRLPAAVVMETAGRLDRIMSRITARPGDGHGSMPPAYSHKALLANMTLRTRMYHAQWQLDQTKLTDHSEINRILKYIRDQYSQDITLKSLAQYVNMDEHYVSALFKKKMGETLIHYVQRTRIEQSKFYLKETNLPVGEICSRVGFANENYFFKLFKRWTGSTPNDFRSS